jgi:hypothetical protein
VVLEIGIGIFAGNEQIRGLRNEVCWGKERGLRGLLRGCLKRGDFLFSWLF